MKSAYFLGFLLLGVLFILGMRFYGQQDFYLPWQKNQGQLIAPLPLPSPSTPPTNAPSQSDLALSHINLPVGFSIHYFAKNVPGARSLALGSNGTVYVSTKDKNVIYALPDANHDFRADTVITIDDNLDTPNGIAYKNGDLYVALVDTILKYSSIDTTYDQSPTPTPIFSAYPTNSHHGWKYIAFGPDDMLYLPVGAPCNICDREEPYGTITKLDVNNPSQGYIVVARGVRNSVGFAWDPLTDKLWFTDNGRDLLGDNLPPDELNRLDTEPAHFGYPYCHAGTLLDPQFGIGKNCDDYQAPQENLSPHTAALGMKFYTGAQFPPEYQRAIFIAEHGSWNRSEKIGYRITKVLVGEDGNARDYSVFASGWLSQEKVLGRPVDVLVYTDGSLLVSDDYAGSIYRISYTP